MENPMQLYFCSYKGKIKETMRKHDGSEFWDVCLIIINLKLTMNGQIDKNLKPNNNFGTTYNLHNLQIFVLIACILCLIIPTKIS